MSRSNHEGVDIWEVRLPDDFDVKEYPPPDLPYAESNGFLWTTGPIPPERLRLHTEVS